MSDLGNERPPIVRRLRQTIDPIGYLLTEGFHLLGLFAIGGATVWAALKAFFDMSTKGHASIEDLLLLFIYLEIGSMVGIYFRTNHMPVRFLLYVGITALTRHMIGYVQREASPDVGILILAGATLILSLAVLTIRYASARFSESATAGRRETRVRCFVARRLFGLSDDYSNRSSESLL